MLRKAIFTLILIFSALEVTANTIQVFYPGAFLNPAAMQGIKDSRMLSGVFIPNISFKFDGTVAGRYGKIKSNNTLFLPYLQGAHRIMDRVVLGVDVSNPIMGYVTWPINGFQSAFGVNTILQSYEVTPKLSVSLTQKFAIGGSFRYFSIYRGQLDYTALGSLLTNNATGQSIGGAVGCWWMINPQTFFDFSYFSPIDVVLHGTSSSGPFKQAHLKTSSFTYSPGTYIVNVSRLFGTQFALAAKVTYSCWSPNKQLKLLNPAVGPRPTIVRLNLQNTFSASLRARYQPFKRVAFVGTGGYDQCWVDAKHNLLLLPFGDLWFGGGGLEINFSQRAWLKLFVGQGKSSSPKIQGPSPALVNGTNKSTYTWGDVSGVVDF